MDVGDESLASPLSCLQAITSGSDLSASDCEALFADIMDGDVGEPMIAALLAALHTKGESVSEIVGAARVMRDRATPISTNRCPLVDTCGTGGDFSGTFNVSTAAAFVAASAGVAVAKHGNRAASSKCGSADVLEDLGVDISLDGDAVGRCIDDLGIGFLFAPLFHPAMKHAIGARKAIGIRSIFNLVGPLTNPAGATRQVLGVASPELVESMAAVLSELGSEHALVVHGLEGLDEISVCGPTLLASVRQGHVERVQIDPGELGLNTFDGSELSGGEIDQNSVIVRAVLNGEGSPAQTAVVTANGGAAIFVGGGAQTLLEGVQQAAELIGEGAPGRVLDELIELSRGESD